MWTQIGDWLAWAGVILFGTVIYVDVLTTSRKDASNSEFGNHAAAIVITVIYAACIGRLTV